MLIQCTAVFENGVLRPTTPPALDEGEEVQLMILSQRPDATRRTPAEIIAAIAALPMETDDPGFSGQDHDRILYGEQGAR